jgi:hypothetical protein
MITIDPRDLAAALDRDAAASRAPVATVQSQPAMSDEKD